MTTADKVLLVLLRLFGVTALLALVAVAMPFSWMVATHRWLGQGQLPDEPVVKYLARSLSLFYGFFGALCLALAMDLERYRPLVRFLGSGVAVMGIVAVGIDLAAGMPWWWSAVEGPRWMVFGPLLWFLARPDRSKRDGE